MIKVDKHIPVPVEKSEYSLGKLIFDALKESGDSCIVSTDNPKKILIRLSRLAGENKLYCYRKEDKYYRFWKI